MVLHLPEVVDPEPVGQLDLLQGVLEEAVLVAGRPRPRELVLVEDTEAHDALVSAVTEGYIKAFGARTQWRARPVLPALRALDVPSCRRPSRSRPSRSPCRCAAVPAAMARSWARGWARSRRACCR